MVLQSSAALEQDGTGTNLATKHNVFVYVTDDNQEEVPTPEARESPDLHEDQFSDMVPPDLPSPSPNAEHRNGPSTEGSDQSDDHSNATIMYPMQRFMRDLCAYIIVGSSRTTPTVTLGVPSKKGETCFVYEYLKFSLCFMCRCETQQQRAE